MKSKCKKGFTMIEVVVALAIFGILIVPVSDGIISLMKLNNQSRINMDIASVMNMCAEYEISTDFEDDDFDLRKLDLPESTYDYINENFEIDVGDIKDVASAEMDGIGNDKCDIGLKLDRIGNLYMLNIESGGYIKKTFEMGPDDSVKVTVRSLDDGNLQYSIDKSGKNNDPYIYKTDVIDNEPYYGISFDGGNLDLKFNLMVDGVYGKSGSGEIIDGRSVCVNYIDKGSANFVSMTDNIVFSETEGDAQDSKQTESKVTITVRNKKTGLSKTQDYYFTKRIK